MAAVWTERELSTLSQNLHDGFPVNSMTVLIPTRGIGAIIQKAQDFDFGVKTSKVDGMARFYLGLKHRQGEVRNAPMNGVKVPVAAQVRTIHIEPRRIELFDGFSANELAVNMLQDYGLNINPEIIYQLSLHILNE